MKVKIILISLIGLLIVGGGGASAYFFILKDDPVQGATVGEEGGGNGKQPEELPPALFHNLPPLVVSANYQGRLRYLQVKLSVMTRDEDTQDLLLDSTPLIQDALILLLGKYEFTELETTEGKELLRKEARTKIAELIHSDEIESVLFTGFVIQ